MLPTGTVTFLFSDIEGSTRLLHALGDGYAEVLEQHRAVIRRALAETSGVEVDASGDAFFAAFPTARGAVQAAATIQRGLAAQSWPQNLRLLIRMGLHTGEPNAGANGYTGMDVHRAARICAAAHGGQVLISESTRELIADDLPPGTHLRDLGEHRLKDLNRPAHLYQLTIEGLRAEFPPLRTLDIRPHNLPVQPTPLVGRERDLDAVIELICRPTVRLVTLTGPGGTGKTRLSLQAAANLIDRFDDGVFFVPLAFTSDPALVPTAIAQALGVRENPAVSMLDALAERLDRKQLLLLIDNFEQVASAAPFLADLLRIAPRVKALVTSRTVLHLSGEHEYPVPPLDLPAHGRSQNAVALSQYAAVQLFVQRAKAVRPDFIITDDNAPAVAEICFRLDGLPLAIELAAARSKLFSPGELLIRLSRPFELLRGGPRDVPDRHQTLQRAIEWSYDLLEPAEQILFRRLSVFSGGCRLDAAEAVCAQPEAELEWIDVIDGVAALVDKSLLRAVDAGPNVTRFFMLETIREFGLERLRQSGEEHAVRRAHAEYMARLAEEAEPHLTAPDLIAWLDRLEREHDNIRLALTRATLPDEIETGRRIGASIWRFWMVRGFLVEGRRQLERLHTIGPPSPNRGLWIKLLNGVGTMIQIGGDFPHAAEILQEVLETSLESGEPTGIASSLNNLSWVLLELGEVDRARELSERSLEVCRQAGVRRLEAAALNNLGMIALTQCRFADALALTGESIAIRREIGEKRAIGYAIGMTVAIHVAIGNYDEAERLTDEALALADEVRDKQGPGYLLVIRGHMQIDRCRFDEAEADLDRAMPIWMEMGAKYGIAMVTGGRGLIALSRGDHDLARSLVHDSLRVFSQTQQKRGIGITHIYLGDVELARGCHGEALAAYECGLRDVSEIGERRFAAHALMGIAAVHRARGESESAREHLTRARALLDELGLQPTAWQIARGLAPWATN